MAEGGVIHEGFLEKLAVSAPTVLKNWKKRWIIVRPQLIAWVERSGDEVQEARSLKLSKGTIVAKSKGQQIQIVVPEGTKLLLRLTKDAGPSSTEEWVNAIKEAIKGTA
eukprot:1844094-Prymnesium_polylepis.1